jgi:hypothetical protein
MENAVAARHAKRNTERLKTVSSTCGSIKGRTEIHPRVRKLSAIIGKKSPQNRETERGNKPLNTKGT